MSEEHVRMQAWNVTGAVGVLAYGVAMVAGVDALLLNPSPEQPVLLLPAAFFVVAAVVLSIRAACDGRLDRCTRSAWKWITASFVMLLTANVLFMISWPFFPSPPDLLRLGMVPVLVTGILKMPMRRRGHRLTIAMDAATVAIAGGAFLWYLLIGPVVSAPGVTAAQIIAGSLYPLGDLVLVFGMSLVLLRGEGTVNRPTRVLVAASAPWLIGDCALAYQRTHLGGGKVEGWVMLFFVTAHFGLAAAAFFQVAETARANEPERYPRVRRVSRLPYAAVAAGFGLLLYVAVDRDALYPWGGLVLCAFLLTALVGVRQLIAQNENHRMAVTDALTGLANRSRLHEALGIALDRAGRQGHITAVLLTDLNGFKQVNDTLGHAAGDQLLVAYANMLRRSAKRNDVTGRLGGDEFAVILHQVGSAANAEAVARRIVNETQAPVVIGDVPVRVSGSIGIALSGPGELDVDELMRRADHAMYAAKRAKTSSWHVDAEPVFPAV